MTLSNPRQADPDAPTLAGAASFSSPPDVEPAVPFASSARLDIGAVCDTGKVRESNQDGYIACRIGRSRRDRMKAVVFLLAATTWVR